MCSLYVLQLCMFTVLPNVRVSWKITELCVSCYFTFCWAENKTQCLKLFLHLVHQSSFPTWVVLLPLQSYFFFSFIPVLFHMTPKQPNTKLTDPLNRNLCFKFAIRRDVHWGSSGVILRKLIVSSGNLIPFLKKVLFFSFFFFIKNNFLCLSRQNWYFEIKHKNGT